MSREERLAYNILTAKVHELNEFLQGLTPERWGDNVIDIAMDLINEQCAEIEGLKKTIDSMKSEISYALKPNKSKETNRFYLENAVRYADRALMGGEKE